MGMFLKVAAEVQHSVLPASVTKDIGSKMQSPVSAFYDWSGQKLSDRNPLAHLSNLLKGFIIISLTAHVFSLHLTNTRFKRTHFSQYVKWLTAENTWCIINVLKWLYLLSEAVLEYTGIIAKQTQIAEGLDEFSGNQGIRGGKERNKIYQLKQF